jgi:hypothetical protein
MPCTGLRVAGGRVRPPHALQDVQRRHRPVRHCVLPLPRTFFAPAHACLPPGSIDGVSSQWVAGLSAGGRPAHPTFKYNPAFELTVQVFACRPACVGCPPPAGFTNYPEVAALPVSGKASSHTPAAPCSPSSLPFHRRLEIPCLPASPPPRLPPCPTCSSPPAACILPSPLSPVYCKPA